uniref:Uncharacterized protein n=1 Tax=Ananas comosus var. bracteatus TaxID=296719 RepID=A0A6V7QLY6_ANACO|nr:unnamed protein product [Ananas comosus var. bracteatus]
MACCIIHNFIRRHQANDYIFFEGPNEQDAENEGGEGDLVGVIDDSQNGEDLCANITNQLRFYGKNPIRRFRYRIPTIDAGSTIIGIGSVCEFSRLRIGASTSISLSSGIARIANNVSSQCYNAKNGNVTNKDYWLSLGTSPYRFSSTSTREGRTEQWLLHGHRMLPDQHPKGIVYSRVWFDKYLNSSETYNFSRCGYAALVEEGAFNFSTSYITTSELYGEGCRWCSIGL